MTLATILIATVWAGVTLYAVLGGADFGSGLLHLLARGGDARAQRRAISTAMGPAWEANHVWLIFVITGLFSTFPRAFAALGTVAFLPATLALVAIVVRGCAFAFAGHLEDRPRVGVATERLFAAASVAAPFLLGMVAGGVALQRAHPGVLGFWIGPFQLVVGALALALCAALAATVLAADRSRAGDHALAAGFRRRAVWALRTAVAFALAALALSSGTSPALFSALVGRALPVVLAAVAAAIGALAALAARRDRLARALVAISAAAVVWGWGVAQYPRLVAPGLTVGNAAAGNAELTAVAIALGAGAFLLAPAMWLLHVAFQRTPIEVIE
jgi:cytochrome bd ubiquinol oxidase subunit II